MGDEIYSAADCAPPQEPRVGCVRIAWRIAPLLNVSVLAQRSDGQLRPWSSTRGDAPREEGRVREEEIGLVGHEEEGIGWVGPDEGGGDPQGGWSRRRGELLVPPRSSRHYYRQSRRADGFGTWSAGTGRPTCS